MNCSPPAPDAPGSASPRIVSLAAASLLILLTFAAYSPALRAGWVWDDDDWIVHNPRLDDADGLRRIWFEPGAVLQYYPLTYTTWWLDKRLWAENPLGYHLENIALHGLSALLVWRILRRLGLPAAYLAALVFALHPVHVESVAWATERKNVLFVAFYLASLLAYLRFARVSALASTDPKRPSVAAYLAALVLFICAMLSKTMACSLPAVLLLLLWWRRGRLRLADLFALVPFFLVGAALGLFSAAFERRTLGAEGPDWDLNFLERTLIAGRALCFYAAKLLWPRPIIFVYPKWQIDAADWRQYLYPAAALAVLFVAALGRRRWGYGPLVALLCFGGTLLPALGYFNVFYMRYSYVADHFQYVSSIALLALICNILRRTLAALPTAVRGTPARENIYHFALALLLAAVLGGLTFSQARAYRDKETLYRDTLASNPDAWLAHSGLGLELQKQGDYFGAAKHYGESARLRPDYDKVHYDWATALERIGDVDRARQEYEFALRLNDRHVEARMNLGLLHMRRGEHEPGLRELARAVELAPDDVRALSNLGAAWMQVGNYDAAERILRSALRLDPEYEFARRNLDRLHAIRRQSR